MNTQTLEQPIAIPQEWITNTQTIEFESFDPEENVLMDVDSHKARH